MDKSNNAGFSYIEVMIAMAILAIVLIPIIPALTRAAANHHYAVGRRQAQGYAVTLALNAAAAVRAGDGAGNVTQVVDAMSSGGDGLVYRVVVAPIGEPSRVYVSGNAEVIPLIPSPGVVQFQSDSAGLFAGGVFVIAEVFDSQGNLAGMSVGKVNLPAPASYPSPPLLPLAQTRPLHTPYMHLAERHLSPRLPHLQSRRPSSY